MQKFIHDVHAFLRDDFGQDLVEYGLIVGLIGLGGIASMSRLAGSVGTFFNSVGSTLTSAT